MEYTLWSLPLIWCREPGDLSSPPQNLDRMLRSHQYPPLWPAGPHIKIKLSTNPKLMLPNTYINVLGRTLDHNKLNNALEISILTCLNKVRKNLYRLLTVSPSMSCKKAAPHWVSIHVYRNESRIGTRMQWDSNRKAYQWPLNNSNQPNRRYFLS